MTQNPGHAAGTPQQTSGMDRFFAWLRALDVRRDTQDKWLAGVCSGIAHRLGVDPLVIRAALIVLILLGGVGVTLYLIAWAFIPTDQEEILAERGLRGGDFWGIAILVLIALSLVGGSGFFDGNGWGLWWLWWIAVPVGFVVWLVTRNRSGESVPRQQVGTWSQQTAAAGAGSPTTSQLASGAPYAGGPQPAHGTGGPAGPSTYGPGPVPPRPPRPPRPRHRVAGFLPAVIVSGVALAAYGLTVWAHGEYSWSGDEHVLGLAAALTVVGLSVLGMGLAGFRSGLTGFIAVVLAITTWFASVVPGIQPGAGVGDREWRPLGTTSSEQFTLSVGSANLHLGDYPTSPATPGRVNASVGVGELRIYVPSDLTVRINSDVNVGEIKAANGWGLNQNNQLTQDGQGGQNLSSTVVIGSGPTDVVVNASVGLGQITIGKE